MKGEVAISCTYVCRGPVSEVKVFDPMFRNFFRGFDLDSFTKSSSSYALAIA